MPTITLPPGYTQRRYVMPQEINDIISWVTCPKCGKINEDDVEFIDYLEEESQSEDYIEFRCPKCRGVSVSEVELEVI